MPNELVQTRIDGAVKKEAAAVLAPMGLTISDAVLLLLTRVAHEKALPFALVAPNAATIEAMREAREGNLPQFATVGDLFDDLHDTGCYQVPGPSRSAAKAPKSG